MRLFNKTILAPLFVSSLFLSIFLITALVMGSGCGGNSQNGQTTTTGTTTTGTTTSGTPTPPDPQVIARQAFKDKVWTPYLASDRCVHCHDFVKQAGATTGVSFTHPTLYDPVTNPTGVRPTNGVPALAANCNGCHTAGVFPFPTVAYPTAIWQDVPPGMVWNAATPSDDVRTKIIANEGDKLCKHLIGEGADAAPVVQWGFSNSPNIPTNPPTPGDFHGKTPGPYASPLLDWPAYKTAVSEWLCLEAKIPGGPDLGVKAPCLVCP